MKIKKKLPHARLQVKRKKVVKNMYSASHRIFDWHDYRAVQCGAVRWYRKTLLGKLTQIKTRINSVLYSGQTLAQLFEPAFLSPELFYLIDCLFID